MTPVSIVCWFAKAYRVIGLKGCSSHSGRRTFITRRPGWCIRPVVHYGMSSCWRVIGPSKRPSDTSTATPMPSASWYR